MRAAIGLQIQSDDVELGDQSVAQLMQTDAFEQMINDPEFQALASDPGFQALAQYPEALSAMV